MRNQTGVSFANSNCKDLQGNRLISNVRDIRGKIAILLERVAPVPTVGKPLDEPIIS
jgi:hypothetical protein